jgi:hypothetical protein
MRIIGTVVEIGKMNGEVWHYKLRCPKVIGGPIGCGFVGPAEKYKVGDEVNDSETAPKIYAGKWSDDGKVLY